MLFAYARVSTKEQNLERQIQKSMTLGIDSRYIFCRKGVWAFFSKTTIPISSTNASPR